MSGLVPIGGLNMAAFAGILRASAAGQIRMATFESMSTGYAEAAAAMDRFEKQSKQGQQQG